MGRPIGWLRSLRLWFVDQQELRARVVRLEQALADERAEHYGQIADYAERYARDVGLLREDVAGFRMECERREQDQAEAERRVLAERAKGNEGWQEAGIQRRRADALQAERDQLRAELDLLAEVEHVAVGD